MKFDLHLHTRRHSPDSVTNPYELVARALAVGLDGVVLTEHGYLWTEAELEELRNAAPGLVILGGIEVTGVGGDVLAYGVTNPFTLPQGIEWPALCREVRRQGGAAVAAHPYRWGQPFDNLLAKPGVELDGVEVMSNNMDPDLRRKAAAVLGRHPSFAQLGNSDSHDPDTVGCCYTEFDADIRTNADLVAAIKGRKGVARVNPQFGG